MGETEGISVRRGNSSVWKNEGPPRHNESWWWNDEVDEAVTKKRRLYMETEKVERRREQIGKRK